MQLTLSWRRAEVDAIQASDARKRMEKRLLLRVRADVDVQFRELGKRFQCGYDDLDTVNVVASDVEFFKSRHEGHVRRQFRKVIFTQIQGGQERHRCEFALKRREVRDILVS